MKALLRRHEEKIRFVVVGGWNTVFGYLVFAGLYYLLRSHLHYLLLLAASYIISITNAYLGYKFAVFKTRGNYLREYLRFYLVYGVSFLVNLILLPVLVEALGLHPLVAQALILFFTTVISYTGHKYYSFSVPARAMEQPRNQNEEEA
ncbi:MAG: GtrA family protein [Syntrophomonadaceae bacterium]|nr:GtrA family protein [Syntrophomonadaceae bacterium]